MFDCEMKTGVKVKDALLGYLVWHPYVVQGVVFIAYTF